ncbi:MAG: GIY-YIG nuclease family protein [Candidatus Magasanikbacteria bacterium]|nr:GIY-YIG nuclease family protein [Candidatus Magasanikbacteria bacterium]
MPWTVYVLTNKKDQCYKGITENLGQRLSYHNNGLGHWTKYRGPWRLIYRKDFENKTEALKHEKFLKSGKGRDAIKNLQKNTNGL